MTTQTNLAEQTQEPAANDPTRLYWLQKMSKIALRNSIVATERYRRALKVGKQEGHYAPMEAAHRERTKTFAIVHPTQHQELIARQEAAKILRGDTDAKRCRCKVCACNCDQPGQVQCDTHGPRE